MAKKIGRPALSGEAKGNLLQIRLTDEERASIDRAADAAGKGASTWVRDEALRLAAAAEKKAKKK